MNRMDIFGIIALGIIFGIPVYALIGSRVARYVIAVLWAFMLYAIHSREYSYEYERIRDNFKWWMVAIWPCLLSIVVLVVCGLIVCALSLSAIVYWMKLIQWCFKTKKGA